MTSLPKVSVVVAAFNVVHYLPRCVDSLLQQTEPSIEILLIDDGSTDGTALVVDACQDRDARVRAVHRTNGGLSVARNTGLLAARGDYVCFVDGDDWVEPDLIASMVATIESAEVPVVVAGAIVDFHDDRDQLVSSDRRTLPSRVIVREVPLADELPDENLINLLGYAWNKLYRREWLVGLGVTFEPGLSLIEDIVFNAQVLGAADRVALVPGCFVHYVQRPRVTLGTAHDHSFLNKRGRAIDSVDRLLGLWGVDRGRRDERRSLACGSALWTALRVAASDTEPVARLRQMMQQTGAENVVLGARSATTRGRREAWATMTFRRRRYRLGLVPIRLLMTVRRPQPGRTGVRPG